MKATHYFSWSSLLCLDAQSQWIKWRLLKELCWGLKPQYLRMGPLYGKKSGLLLSRDEITLVKGGSLTQDDQCPYKKRQRPTRRQRWSNLPTNHRIIMSANTINPIGRGKEGLLPVGFKGSGLANSLIWDFWPPEQWEDFLVVCHLAHKYFV